MSIKHWSVLATIGKPIDPGIQTAEAGGLLEYSSMKATWEK